MPTEDLRSSSARSRPRRRVAENELISSRDESPGHTPDSGLLFTQGVAHGGCSHGLIVLLFQFTLTRRGVPRLIWDLNMPRYWWSQIISRHQLWMWLPAKAGLWSL